jgi:hypothetical protein
MSLSLSEQKVGELYELTSKFEQIIHAFNKEIADLLKDKQSKESDK